MTFTEAGLVPIVAGLVVAGSGYIAGLKLRRDLRKAPSKVMADDYAKAAFAGSMMVDPLTNPTFTSSVVTRYAGIEGVIRSASEDYETLRRSVIWDPRTGRVGADE